MNNEDKIIDITWQLKKAKARNMIHQAWESTKDFVKQNREWVLGVGVPLAVTAVSWTVKTAVRQSHINETQRLKDNYIYDNRHGIYFETKRRMTNQERLEYSRRRDEGESVEQILRSMKILK